MFIKLMKPVFASFRSNFGLICISYIDGSLYFGETYEDCEEATLAAAQILISVGLKIYPV